MFLLSHAIPARPQVRAALIAALGERWFLVVYSIIALAVLAWLIVAAGRAPFVELWPFEPWQMWAPNLAMPLVCVLAAFGVGAANPLSFGGNPNRAFDPAQPGIVGLVRHPLLWAIGLWAAAHLVPNGDLAHVMLFGFFVGHGAARHGDHRSPQAAPARRVSDGQRSPRTPHSCRLSRCCPGAGGLARSRSICKRLAIGLAAWLTLLLLHAPVIGVSPLP